MRKLLFIVCLLISTLNYSQEYYIDHNNPKALKLYQVNRPEQADIKVFIVNNKTQTNNKGLWFIGKRTPTAQAIRYVSFAEQADIKFYIVKTKEQAGKTKKA